MKAETWASCVRDTVTGMKHHVQTKSGTQAQEENIVCRLCLGWVQAMERRRAHFQAHRSSKDFEVIQGHEGSTVCRRYPGCRHTKAATCRGRVWDTSTRRQHRVQALSGTQVYFQGHEGSTISQAMSRTRLGCGRDADTFFGIPWQF